MNFSIKAMTCIGMAALCAAAGERVMLPWNGYFSTGTYEVDFHRGRLIELLKAEKDSGFAVYGQTADGVRQLPSQLLSKRNGDEMTLRFQAVPGMSSVFCEAAGTAVPEDSSDVDNLFAGALSSEALGRWILPKEIKAEATEDGIVLRATTWGKHFVSYDIPVPAGAHGPVRFEYDAESLAKMGWVSRIQLFQYNAEGKLLTDCVVDPRWISHVLPPNKKVDYREAGRIRPDTRKIRLRLELRAVSSRYDNGGLQLADSSALLPALKITHLTLRSAELLPITGYDGRFFAKDGVSGAPSDLALDMRDGKIFMWTAMPQGGWAELRTIQDERELFLPSGDGTFEGWFRPDWSKADNEEITLFDTLNRWGYFKGARSPERKDLHRLYYSAKKGEIGIYLKDGQDHVYSMTAAASLPDGQWSHVAFQWSATGGVQVFVNGIAVIHRPDWLFAGIDIASEADSNGRMPLMAAIGHTVSAGRSDGYSEGSCYHGLIDGVRMSRTARYEGNFTPLRRFSADEQTCALFNFDYSFDGISETGGGFVEGMIRAPYGKVSTKLNVNGVGQPWFPEKITALNDPAVQLHPLNYPVLPKPSDFQMGRRTNRESFSLSLGDTHEVRCEAPIYMDYIEIANTSASETLVNPILMSEGDIDPRSFEGIREALMPKCQDDISRVYAIFNFVLGASDYFMSHQAYFPAGTDTPRNVEYMALSMLNAYCGFECGPLNNLTAILFACAGGCPASQTAGYGHSFEEVFYDGKNHLFDMSAQRFFPSFDNISAASLYDAEREPGLMTRMGSGPDHFIRMGGRNAFTITPDYLKQIGVPVRPGERFRIWFANNGMVNDLQASSLVAKDPRAHMRVDMREETHATPDPYSVYRIGRFFPHYSNAFLRFDGHPEAVNPAFKDNGADGFTYLVESGYPVVYGEYAAWRNDGRTVPLEISTDRGKTFRMLKADSDGVCRPVYPVRARHEFLIRIKAPMAEVVRFKATTEMMLNTRVLTGKLHQGVNRLTLKAQSGERADVTVQYRTDDKPIVVGGGVFTGTVPGFERQLVLAEAGQILTLSVGKSSAVSVARTYGGLEATVSDGVLRIRPTEGKIPRFAAVTLRDGEAERTLTVLVARGARLATAAKAAAGKVNATVERASDGRVQDCLSLKGADSRGLFTFEKIPAGRYAVWNVNRFDSRLTENGGKRRQLTIDEDGKRINCGSAINPSCDFYKAQYGQPNGRGRFKWDYPVRQGTPYPYSRPGAIELKETDSLELCVNVPEPKDIEVAAMLLLPEPDEFFYDEMLKILCGLNCDPWLIQRWETEMRK